MYESVQTSLGNNTFVVEITVNIAGYYYNGRNKPCCFGAAYEFLTDDHTCEGMIGLRAASGVEFEDDGHAIAWAMQQ